MYHSLARRAISALLSVPDYEVASAWLHYINIKDKGNMKPVLNWLAAAASLIGLFFTLYPISEGLSSSKIAVVVFITLAFSAVAILDIREDRRRAAKTYADSKAINKYMYKILSENGCCEICSRDASWISDSNIYAVLKEKARRKELTFLVHVITPELANLENLGAEIIEYKSLGFEPITRFTVVNAGNQSSSYVAIARKRPGEQHTIEELDSSHPTYSMARDLIRSIKTANDNFKKD